MALLFSHGTCETGNGGLFGRVTKARCTSSADGGMPHPLPLNDFLIVTERNDLYGIPGWPLGESGDRDLLAREALEGAGRRWIRIEPVAGCRM